MKADVVTLYIGNDAGDYWCERKHDTPQIATVGVVTVKGGDLHKLCLDCFCRAMSQRTRAKIVIYDC